MSHEAPSQAALFDPDRLTTTGLPADCPSCRGAGVVVYGVGRLSITDGGPLVTCKNCRGTGRAIIPF